MLKTDTVQSNSSSTGSFTWRDKRYKQFYQIVDQLVEEIQAGLRGKDGGAVRRLGNAIWIVQAFCIRFLVTSDDEMKE